MPIEAESSWSQNERELEIRILLKGARAKDVDIFCSPRYIKVAFNQYLNHFDVYDEVDHLSAFAKVEAGHLVLSCKKIKRCLWPSFAIAFDPNVTKTQKRDLLRKRRQESICRKEVIEKENQEAKNAKRTTAEKKMVKEQMRIDGFQRNLLEEKKETEKFAAESEVYQVLQKFKTTYEDSHESNVGKEQTKISSTFINSEIFAATEDQNSDIDGIEIHAPRVPKATVPLSFTPRIFNGPARESVLKQEENFLLKSKIFLDQQTNSFHHYNSDAKDITAEEGEISIEGKDPNWLKDRGNSFFLNGDFMSGVYAYSTAIKTLKLGSSKNTKDPILLAKCLSNRASCFVRLKQLEPAHEDLKAGLRYVESYQEQLKLALRGQCKQRMTESSCETMLLDSLRAKLVLVLIASEEFEEALRIVQRFRVDENVHDRISSLIRYQERKRDGDSKFRKALDVHPKVPNAFQTAIDVYEALINDSARDDSSGFNETFLKSKCMANLASCKYYHRDYQECYEIYESILNNPKEASQWEEFATEIFNRKSECFRQIQNQDVFK